jgi:hypothetical protein
MAKAGAKKQLADNNAHLRMLRIALAVAVVRALAPGRGGLPTGSGPRDALAGIRRRQAGRRATHV